MASDGTIQRGVNVASVVVANAGIPSQPGGVRYEIQLLGPTGAPYTFTTFENAATVTPSCPGADASVRNDDGNPRMLVYIEITGSTDTLGQCGFSFTVTRLPATTG